MNFLKRLFQYMALKRGNSFDFRKVYMQAKFDSFIKRFPASERSEAMEWFFNQPEQQGKAGQELKQKKM